MKNRNEAETRAELIDPALKFAGWGEVPGSRIRREERITLGSLRGGGFRGNPDIADYVLEYRGHKLGVLEAKRENAHHTQGLGQAKRYAEKLGVPFAFSSNGHAIYRVDMRTGQEGDVQEYPSPQELWNLLYGNSEKREAFWRERFGAVPFEDKGGQWQPRYYQHNAINAVLEALAKGKNRMLLTLATGTGKTAIAFQIAWKLFYSRWNLGDWKGWKEPARRPRILFLADRNILADQAFNAFSAFPEDALLRIDPESIRKKGGVPKNGSIFFTIFQTFMAGSDGEGNPQPSFGEYPPDFFDCIIIDECHRGGAQDESSWRGIMEYFSPAVQLGLTATPKRQGNADTYAYFGEPLYVYSLKEGINDGYLTPFKVRQIQTTLDDYIYTPDDEILQGEVEEGRRYGEKDFQRVIKIRERDEKRVELFMAQACPSEKSLVFCANQEHALDIRDIINQRKKNPAPNYCVRVTADDGAWGEQQLRTFQDNEKTLPTVLTTSHKLSTGVDARNVRNIVLMRPINSMIEFKQIIGRGTRLFDGKDYFTIYDFVKAYEHFNDPEWDGPPEAPEISEDPPQENPVPPGVRERKPCPRCGENPCICEKKPLLTIRLADGKAREIDSMMCTSFWSPEGKPISGRQFLESLYGDIPELFAHEEELRRLWSSPETRKKFLDMLGDKGYGEEQLQELARLVHAEKSDLYDVLTFVAYAKKPLSRAERVAARKKTIFSHYRDEEEREFLEFILDHYIRQGISELDLNKLPDLLTLRYKTIADAAAKLGPLEAIRNLFGGFQKYLYSSSDPAA